MAIKRQSDSLVELADSLCAEAFRATRHQTACIIAAAALVGAGGVIGIVLARLLMQPCNAGSVAVRLLGVLAIPVAAGWCRLATQRPRFNPAHAQRAMALATSTSATQRESVQLISHATMRSLEQSARVIMSEIAFP